MEKTIFDEDSSQISSREEYIRKIRDELSVKDSDTEEEIVKNIQISYDKALRHLKDYLFYQNSEFGLAGKIKFNSFDDVISFLDETNNTKGRNYCRIVKQTISWYNTDINFNTQIADVVEKTNGVIERKLIPGLQVKEQNENGFSGIVTIETGNGYRVIPFRFESRLKSQESMVSKEVRDPKYFLLENLSDIYGGKFYLKDKFDILPFSQYVSGLVFKKGIFDIKDRGMFSDQEIKDSQSIHEDFRAKCENRLKDRKKISSDNMRDWRVLAPYKKDDSTNKMSLELGFAIDSGENEAGLGSQYIYSFLRRIDEIIRLDQYIFPAHIGTIVSACIEGMSIEQKEEIFRELRDKHGLIGKKIKLNNNSHARSNIDTYLQDGLSIYFQEKGGIKEIRKNGWKKDRFAYSNDRQISLHDLDLIEKN